MNKFNLMVGWYQLPPAPVKPAEFKEPERCEFCIKPICEGDTYHVGYDVHKIFAMTCDKYKCQQWLKYKVTRKKPWTL
jgi:hypothetical protein